MDFTKFNHYMNRTDERGSFMGVINTGIWKEVNFVSTHAGEVRGGHFHEETQEVIFLLKGEAKVEFQDANHPDDKVLFYLKQGEGVKVCPYILHTITYLTECEQISLLDRLFDPAKPDLHISKEKS